MKKYILLPALFLIYNFTIKGQTYTVESIPFSSPVNPDDSFIFFTGSIDDRWSTPITLPFEFSFFGESYTQVTVSSNGVVSFNTSLANTYHSWVLNTEFSLPGVGGSLTGGNIFFACHDLFPQGDAFIYGYNVFGDMPNRIFAVSFYNISHFACIELKTTQLLLLYEGTNVIENYIWDKPICATWNPPGLAVIGIQNNDATVAYVPPNRNVGVWTAQNEAWRFTPEVLSIDENNIFQFKIYPNPVKDYVTLDFPVEFKNSTIEIINIHGKVVLKQDYVEKTLDVSQFASGVYFLKIKNDLGEKVFKLVKK